MTLALQSGPPGPRPLCQPPCERLRMPSGGEAKLQATRVAQTDPPSHLLH